jgi:hypothetical protein
MTYQPLVQYHGLISSYENTSVRLVVLKMLDMNRTSDPCYISMGDRVNVTGIEIGKPLRCLS